MIKFSLSGEGGEQILFGISKKQYEFFSSKDDEFIRNDALGLTEEVPEDLSLRNWNSERGKYESQGFSFNAANLIIQQSEKVIEISLNEKNLLSKDVKVVREKKQISDFVEDGSTDYFLLGELKETGEVHFELENENNFEIKKLEIKTCSLNNWEIITDVIYDNNMINSVSEENEPLGENFTLAKYAK